jgi:hypothetical protein
MKTVKTLGPFSLLLIIFVLSMTKGIAQDQIPSKITILGVIRDADTRKPITNACVKARYWDPKNLKTVICQEKYTTNCGFFIIDFELSSLGLTLRYDVSKEGYAHKESTFVLTANTEIVILLEKENELKSPPSKTPPEPDTSQTTIQQKKEPNKDRSWVEAVVAGLVSIAFLACMLAAD